MSSLTVRQKRRLSRAINVTLSFYQDAVGMPKYDGYNLDMLDAKDALRALGHIAKRIGAADLLELTDVGR